MMVRCVVTSVYSTICHQARFHRPWASQSMAAFSTVQSGSNILGLFQACRDAHEGGKEKGRNERPRRKDASEREKIDEDNLGQPLVFHGLGL